MTYIFFNAWELAYVHILLLLMGQDACASGLAERLGMPQPAALLKMGKLVGRHREEK